jgi:tetraacyldisaccharide 4'-kinase
VSLVDDWYQPRLTLKTAPLVPAAQLYRALFPIFRPAASREHDFGCAIVVIGNLTVGGTGKTPLTLHLAAELLRRRYKTGIVSRGYPISPSTPLVVDAQMSANECGDEPLLYARAGVPTVVCASRAAAVRALVAHAPDLDVILADDALQHTALPRNVEICVVDGARGFGNGYTLPAGPLREPVSRLQTVDAVVVNGKTSHTIAHHSRFAMTHEIAGVRALSGDETNVERLPRDTTLLAGIGNPQTFFDSVMQFAPGLRGAKSIALPDHHAFTASELNALPGTALLMTEKDAVRCVKIAGELNKTVFYTTTQVTVNPNLTDWLIGQLEQKGYGRKTA